MITPQKNGSNGAEAQQPIMISRDGATVVQGEWPTPGGLLSCSPMVAVIEAGGQRYTVMSNVELVTPEMAKGFLARSHKNRVPAPRRVQAYSRAMARGEWRLTNQGIGLDVANRLIDGGHRCEAIIDSGVPALVLVVRGLPPETQSVVDFNRTRSASDHSVMNDVDKGKAWHGVASVLRLLVSSWTEESEVWSPAERIRFAQTFAPEMEWAFGAFPTKSPFATSSVIAAWAYAYGAAPAVAEWVTSYIDGTGMERGNPLLALRNTIVNMPKRSSMDRRSMALRTLRALWAKMHGEPLLKIYDTAEGVVGFMTMRGHDASKWDNWTSFRR
jgi:hypothetical protein